MTKQDYLNKILAAWEKVPDWPFARLMCATDDRIAPTNLSRCWPTDERFLSDLESDVLQESDPDAFKIKELEQEMFRLQASYENSIANIANKIKALKDGKP